MPNFCENELRVSGNSAEVEKFKEFCKGKVDFYGEPLEKDAEERILDFNNFVPYPKKFIDMDKYSKEIAELRTKLEAGQKLSQDEQDKLVMAGLDGKDKGGDGYNNGGYNWCICNWGTKWNACHIDNGWIEEKNSKKNKQVLLYFDTAWNSPNPVIAGMTLMFPTLNFNLKYWESGGGFRGILICKGGKVIKNASYDYRGGRGG